MAKRQNKLSNFWIFPHLIRPLLAFFLVFAFIERFRGGKKRQTIHLATSRRRHEKRKKPTTPLLRTSPRKERRKKKYRHFFVLFNKKPYLCTRKIRQRLSEGEQSTEGARGRGKHTPQGDLLAQLVEHNTFNVGVMGSSPIQVTKWL